MDDVKIVRIRSTAGNRDQIRDIWRGAKQIAAQHGDKIAIEYVDELFEIFGTIDLVISGDSRIVDRLAAYLNEVLGRP